MERFMFLIRLPWGVKFLINFLSLSTNSRTMSLLNQQNNKGQKKDKKKAAAAANAKGGSKFIQKPKSTVFISKQSNTGSQRGS